MIDKYIIIFIEEIQGTESPNFKIEEKTEKWLNKCIFCITFWVQNSFFFGGQVVVVFCFLSW